MTESKRSYAARGVALIYSGRQFGCRLGYSGYGVDPCLECVVCCARYCRIFQHHKVGGVVVKLLAACVLAYAEGILAFGRRGYDKCSAVRACERHSVFDCVAGVGCAECGEINLVGHILDIDKHGYIYRTIGYAGIGAVAVVGHKRLLTVLILRVVWFESHRITARISFMSEDVGCHLDRIGLVVALKPSALAVEIACRVIEALVEKNFCACCGRRHESQCRQAFQ